MNKISRYDLATAAVLFTVVLMLYIRTLAPGLLLSDSAELQTQAYTLGMTHPTGYPVYLLAAHLFTAIPLGDLPYRVNLFSAVLGAAALAFGYLDTRLLGGRRIAAVGGMLALGVSQIFWWQAVIAELYSAAAFLIAAMLFCLLCWRLSQRWIFLTTAGLLGGLSLGVHNTVALAAPAVFIYLLLTCRKRMAWLAALGGAVLGLILSLGAFAFINAINAPSSYFYTTLIHGRSAWGLSQAQVDSFFGRLEFLFGARQFRMYMFVDPLKDMPKAAEQYWQILVDNFTYPAIALALLGIFVWLLRKPNWKEGILILTAWLTCTIFVLNYDIYDNLVFYIPTYVWLSITVGLGATAVLDGCDGLLRLLRTSQSARKILLLIVSLVLAAGILWKKADIVIGSVQAERIIFLDGTKWANWPFPVLHPDQPYKTATFIVNGLKDDAIVFTDWDKLFTYLFVAHVEQHRTGISFHEWFVQDGITGATESTLAYIDANLGKRPIYFDFENTRKRSPKV